MLSGQLPTVFSNAAARRTFPRSRAEISATAEELSCKSARSRAGSNIYISRIQRGSRQSCQGPLSIMGRQMSEGNVYMVMMLKP
ncbi:hypothetical protein WJX74_002495 [Apatococcus lobatus]|uniref:Uncharacterized protein n=1 Tax=Apatococcus lobatus TaxID=904363 RepID=A0AAW1R3A8_9CHLO